MTYLLWDSSGLGKRYVKEEGDDTADALFALGLPMVTAFLVYIEVASIIGRHRNNGLLSADEFTDARLLLEAEVLRGDMTVLSADDDALLTSIRLADAHNLNSTDAVLLYLFREFAKESGESCLLIASDLRLLRAATAKGLPSLNPQTTTPKDLQKYRL